MNKNLINEFEQSCASVIGAEHGYGWGEESSEESDCSGIVYQGLSAIGFPMRLTAHDYWFNVFTVTIKDFREIFTYDAPTAAFYIDTFPPNIMSEPDRPILRATHCIPFIGNGIGVHANYKADKIEPITLHEMIDYAIQTARKLVFCKLNIEHAGSRLSLYDFDKLEKPSL